MLSGRHSRRHVVHFDVLQSYGAFSHRRKKYIVTKRNSNKMLVILMSHLRYSTAPVTVRTALF